MKENLDMMLEIAEYWVLHAPEAEKNGWARDAYLDEVQSWPVEKIKSNYKSMKGK